MRPRAALRSFLALVSLSMVAVMAVGTAAEAAAAKARPGSGKKGGRTALTLQLGVSTPAGPWDMGEVDAFAAEAGKAPSIVMWYSGWAYEGFRADHAQQAAKRGAVPMVTWEPWDYRAGLDQPEYRLSTIAAGAHDEYVRQWARDAAAYGGPVLLRFAHEMNGAWYPWSEQANGNAAGEYVAAWRHVHRLVRAEGATNVAFVWSPNVDFVGATPLASLYPGDAYVDRVALDGYNGGTELPWGGWQSPRQVFGPSLDQLAVIAPGKDVLIGETSSAEAGGSKAAWITDLFSFLHSRPAVKGVVWFHHDKEADWRITSSEAARQAFATAVADSRVG